MAAEPSASTIFPRTDWQALNLPIEGDAARLDQLIRQYWRPLRVFLTSTFPSLRDQADLLLQDFAEDKLLKAGWLQRANRQRGQFREFLKTSLRNFVLDRLSRADLKNPPISLDGLEAELPQPEAAVEEFDLEWARAVLAETLRRMEADCRDPTGNQPRRTYIWELFRVRLIEPLLQNAAQTPYEQLIGRFGLKSPLEASNMLLTAKRIFKIHLTKVIQEYTEQDDAAAEEIRRLEEFLARLAKRRPSGASSP
jgi:DNA-directed RNA polymerase specialized sigma24 family protein